MTTTHDLPPLPCSYTVDILPSHHRNDIFTAEQMELYALMANRWLFKTEPSAYSFQQLQKDQKTIWDGVANNLALKNLKDIKKGDFILIYHTGDERQAVGVARALGGAYPDPSKKDPKALVVDIEAVKPLARPVTLAQVKADKKLAHFDLVRLGRLSIMKVSADHWKRIEEMARG